MGNQVNQDSPNSVIRTVLAAALQDVRGRLVPPVITHAGGDDEHADKASGTWVAMHRAANSAIDTKEPEDELESVKNLSAREADEQADQRFNNDTLKALLLSKSDAIAMEVSFGYLTHHSEQIRNKAILEAPCLQDCRDNVLQAGCEIFPAWANRAICLVPLAEHQASEHLSTTMDMQLDNLQPHHVFIKRCDIPKLHEALFSSLPKRDRPKYRFEVRSDIGEDGLSTSRFGCEYHPLSSGEEIFAFHDDAQDAPQAVDVDAIAVEASGVAAFSVLNTFIHFPNPRSEASSMIHSAPCASQIDLKKNPRRWK